MSERTTSPVLLDDATCFRDVSACNPLIATTLSFNLKDEGHFSENSCKGKAGKKLLYTAQPAKEMQDKRKHCHFFFVPLPDKFRTDIVLADRDTHQEFSDKLRFIFLQLPCFTKEENECENDFERWIYVLKNMETLHRLPFKARKAVFEKLEQIVDIAALSKEERQKYDESIKVYRDSMAVLEYAKQDGMAKGMAKGFAQGIEQGMKQGIEQGIEQGKKSERLQNARKMIEKGIPPTDIADITGLSLEEINRL